MDIVTYALCKKASKSYTDNAIAGLGEGITFNGAVENYSDLPNNPNAGDSYIVHNDESTTPVGKNIQYVYGYDESVGGNTWIQISSGTDPVEIKKVSGTVDNPVDLSELGSGYYLIEGSYKDNTAGYISTFNTPGIVWVDMEDESYMKVINFEGDDSNQLTSYTWENDEWVYEYTDSYALKSEIEALAPFGYAHGEQNNPVYLDDLYNDLFYINGYVYNFDTSQLENLTQPQLIRKEEYKENRKQYLVIENLTDGTTKKYLRNNTHDYTLIDTTYNLTNKDLTETISAQSTNEEVPTAKAVYEYVSENYEVPQKIEGTMPFPANLSTLPAGRYWLKGYVVLYNQPLSSGGGEWYYAKYPIFRGGGSSDSLEWKQYSEFSISEHIEDTEDPNSYYIDIFGEGGNFARIHYDASADYGNWSLVWTIDPRNGERIVE